MLTLPGYKNIIKNKEEGDQDTETEGEEGEHDMEWLPTMREDGITINRLFLEKKHPIGPKDMIVETMGIKAKVGWQGYKHVLHTMTSSIEKTGLKREHELKEFKKQLTKKNKLVKEIEEAKMNLEYIKLTVAWNMGINLKREELVDPILRTVCKLRMDYSSFLTQQGKVEALKQNYLENLEKANKNFLMVEKMEKEAAMSVERRKSRLCSPILCQS